MGKKYYYIATDKDMKCGDFQFKVGEIYTLNRKDNVFIVFKQIENTVTYLSETTDRHFLIEVFEKVEDVGIKLLSNNIRVVKEISRNKIEEYIQNKTTFCAKLFLALYTTNVKMLETLAKDENENIRFAIAENPNTPEHILIELSKDEDWEVRYAVAKNPNTPVYILEELAKDENLDVIGEIIENPNTPIYLLVKLIKSKKEIVRKK